MEVKLAPLSQIDPGGTLLVLANQRNVPAGRTKRVIDLRLFDDIKNLPQVVNELGRASANAQGIKTQMTTYDRLYHSQDRLYLALYDGQAVGFLRVGPKTLFYFPPNGKVVRLDDCPCVLDFYVVEEHQRSGHGKRLFELFLENQSVRPHALAYDRPSYKMFGFLKKHYGLQEYIKQANNFVLFNQFFEQDSKESTGKQAQPLLKSTIDRRQPSSVEKHQQTSALERQDNKLYNSVEKRMPQRGSTQPIIDDFLSSTNTQHQNYRQSFKNSLLSSAHTNLLFHEIKNISQQKQSPIAFGYTNNRQSVARVDPQTFKLRQNGVQSEASQQRMQQAQDEILRLKQEIKQLQRGVYPSMSVHVPKSTSTDYGRFLRRQL